MLETRRLTVRYPRIAQPALRDLSLHIERGETVLLLSPSGGGKSTLARTLTGLIPHDIFAHLQGEVRVNGLAPAQASPGEIAAQVGLLFQDPEAGFATLVVEDEIAFGLENLRLPPAEMPPRIHAALRQVGMSAFLTRRLETLSGGEAQRVALAALLAMQPPTLILDEPTANLDPAATREFFTTLERLRGQHTLLLIEHKLAACAHLADRVILLDGEGRLLAVGEPQRVFREHRAAIDAAGIWLPPELDPERPPPGDFPPLNAHPPAVAVDGLSFGYAKDGYAKEPLLHNLRFTIPQADFVALLGPNGAGKSTLAQLLIGLRTPPPNCVRLFGDPLERLSVAEITRRAGFVFQNPEHQFVTDRVRDELAYSLRARGWDEARIRARVDALLARFDLLPHADRNPFTLSQGQKRRLSVATMLAAGQRLLILDEPTFGQDRRTAYALMDSLAELNRQGVTILMITHDMRLVREYARRALVLLDGRLVFDGAPGDLFAHPDLLARARLT